MWKRTVDLNIISQYRSHLMGISILMVLLCHARMEEVPLPNIFLNLLGLGNKGVDIFFFLSGVGIFYSLEKRQYDSLSNQSLFSWYFQRLKRIFIPYLLIESTYWIWYCVHNGLGIASFLYYISMLSFWNEHVGAWFLALIVPLYIISPFLYLIQNNRFKYIILLFLILIVLLISIIPHSNAGNYQNSIFANIQYCCERIPCYLVGFFIGDMVKKHDKIIWYWLLLPALLFIILFVLPYTHCFSRGWLTGLLLAEFFILVLAFSKSKFTYLKLLGASTLEIYVTCDVLNNTLPLFIPLGGVFYMLQIVASIVLGICFHKIICDKRQD